MAGWPPGFYEGQEAEAVGGAIVAAIEATHDTATLERWILLAATRSSEEVAAEVQASAPTA